MCKCVHRPSCVAEGLWEWVGAWMKEQGCGPPLRFRHAGIQTHGQLHVLPGLFLRRYYVHRSYPETYALLHGQPHPSVYRHIINDSSGFHSAPWVRGKAYVRFVDPSSLLDKYTDRQTKLMITAKMHKALSMGQLSNPTCSIYSTMSHSLHFVAHSWQVTREISWVKMRDQIGYNSTFQRDFLQTSAQ